MSTNPLGTPSIAGPAGVVASATGTTATQPERAKVAELAQEFEAFFVVQMLRQMRQSMLDEPDKDGLGADTMTDTMDVELGRQLSRTGGLGLSQMLQGAMDRQLLGTSASDSGPSGSTPATAPAASVPVPSLAPVALPVGGQTAGGPAMPLPIAAPISSAFGVRTDPIDGTSRFHAGIDIQAAYGKEVPAAGAGVVVFSGAQGGYGNTVVIDHQGGVQTRYAHLSSIQVEAGAQVAAGSVIGRVGSSGRSTGPHLHFEVLQNGHPVNPEVAASKFAGVLKFGGVVADLPTSQSSQLGVAVGVDDEDSGQ